MAPHLPTVALASMSMLSMSALTLLLFGLTQRTYRGHGWWVAAQALLAGASLMLVQPEIPPLLLPLVTLLTLQWPVTVLVGLRRHFARHEWRLPHHFDWLLLSFAFALWLTTTAAGIGPAAQVATCAMGSAALCAYAAWLVSTLPDFPHTSALKLFAGAALALAVYHACRLVAANALTGSAAPPLAFVLAGALLYMAVSLVMVCFALLLISERTEANLLTTQRQLRVLADVDMLTGIANRRHFLESAELLLRADDQAPNTVVMIDIDHFKQVNDLLGHAVGDEALRQIALCVRETLRERDIAGRLGGDEFAVILPDTTMADAMGVASRIVARLEHRQVAPRVARLSLSFGIVQAHPGEPIVEALRRADQALYEAKRQGRSRAVAASGDAARPVFGESRPMGLIS